MTGLNAIGSTVETLNENADELFDKLASVNGLLEEIEKRFERLPSQDDLDDLAFTCQKICQSLDSAANDAASDQYGMAFVSLCQSSTSRNSGGHGVVIQFGCFAPSKSPGQPEKVTTVGTPIFAARRTVWRNSSSSARAVAGSGCNGLPWHERAPRPAILPDARQADAHADRVTHQQ